MLKQGDLPFCRYVLQFQQRAGEIGYRLHIHAEGVPGRLDFLAVSHGDAVADADAGVVSSGFFCVR